MKILITGGNGYIATSLYKFLQPNHEVTTINRTNFDLRNSKAVNAFFEDKFYDVVLHCAVVGGNRLKQDSYVQMDDNLKMYYNLHTLKDHYKKFITFGSGAEVYAKDTCYGLSKYVISKSILDTDNFYNIRIFAVFDEQELDQRFIKANIKRYINKEPLIIHKNKKMDFFYMKDFLALVDFYLKNNSPQKQFDCTYSISPTLLDIAVKINNLTSYKSDIKIVDETGLDQPYTGVYTSSLNYIGLDAGITEVYNKLNV